MSSDGQAGEALGEPWREERESESGRRVYFFGRRGTRTGSVGAVVALRPAQKQATSARRGPVQNRW